MILGYNADAVFGNTIAEIIDYAKILLSSLIDKREGDDVGCRYSWDSREAKAGLLPRSCADLLYLLGIRLAEL